MVRPQPTSTLFPYTTLFRSDHEGEVLESFVTKERDKAAALKFMKKLMKRHGCAKVVTTDGLRSYRAADRKSTRLNSSHSSISYAVFCLKKKNQPRPPRTRRA